ncbi:MAG: c-type cytochrome [Kordiimonadaceae bacterium]|nr:c-type cytochrome [Kordiimonadaceae bacterium]
MKLIYLITSLLLISSPIANAQSPFENPENLQILPKDIPPERLRAIMRNFSFALDVRCTHCHLRVEEDGEGRMVFDSDEKETKKIAREMMKMSGGINRDIRALNRGDDHQYTRVQCTTCHHGQENPFLIQSVMDGEIATGGVEAAKAKYAELKEKYYGGHTYDFSGFTLSEYANSLMEKGNMDQALDIALYSQQSNPKTPYAHTMVGNIYMAQEDYANAAKAYEASLKVDPEQGFIQDQLDKAKAAMQ